MIAEFFCFIRRERVPTVIPKLKSSTIRVTESWVEMCITEDRLIDPEEHVAYKPLATPMPVPGKGYLGPVRIPKLNFQSSFVAGLKGKAIHLSGYQETSELWILRRLVRAFGELSLHLCGHCLLSVFRPLCEQVPRYLCNYRNEEPLTWSAKKRVTTNT
jgi:hypothetical protein